MENVKIKGLNNKFVDIILSFMSSKLEDEKYINRIKLCGNSCDMDWMEDMDISGDDMLHELFELYGDEINDTYTLKINDYIFKTYKEGEDWTNIYYVV